MDETPDHEIDPETLDAITKVFPEGVYFTFRACVSGEQANGVVSRVHLIAWTLREMYPHISYTGLKRIIFAGDYHQALIDLGKEFNRTFTTTTEPTGMGVAITNNVPGGCIVVLEGWVASILLGSQGEVTDRAIAVVAHELCHVSDNTHQANVFRDVWLQPAAGLGGVFLPGTLALWSEYFANRYSSSFIRSPQEMTGLLNGAIGSVEADISDAVHKYRTNHDLDKVLNIFQGKLRFLTQCVGYAAGLLHGMEISIQERDPVCAATIAGSRLAPHWDPLLAELAELDRTYKDWNGTALDPLKRRIQVIAASYGFHYRVLENGSLYVDIPR